MLNKAKVVLLYLFSVVIMLAATAGVHTACVLWWYQPKAPDLKEMNSLNQF